jgi:hypothetical protein
VVSYDISALLERFDVKVEGEGAVTGKLSSLLGESLVLTALAHYLGAVENHEVEVLGGRPERDNAAWGDDRSYVPRQKVLDAWLVLGDGQLVAVECKHWTSSSTHESRSVPEDSEARAAYAMETWTRWVTSAFGPQAGWTDDNKVALPLKPPEGMPSRDMADVRRILAVWTPTSENGRSCMSRPLVTKTVRGGELADTKVEVFSASMYLRGLLADGMKHLEAEDEYLEKVLAALNAVVRATGLSSAG